MPAPAPERRKATRTPATGRVEILFGDPVPVCIDVSLMSTAVLSGSAIGVGVQAPSFERVKTVARPRTRLP